MSIRTEHDLQYLYARIAGFSYIIFTVAGLIKNFLLNTRLSDPGAIQSNSIFANEMHFRLGIVAEAIMFLGVIMASVSFYVVLKSVNKQPAQTALSLRLVEIIIGGIAVVIASSFRVPAYEYSWIAMGVNIPTDRCA